MISFLHQSLIPFLTPHTHLTPSQPFPHPPHSLSHPQAIPFLSLPRHTPTLPTQRLQPLHLSENIAYSAHVPQHTPNRTLYPPIRGSTHSFAAPPSRSAQAFHPLHPLALSLPPRSSQPLPALRMAIESPLKRKRAPLSTRLVPRWDDHQSKPAPSDEIPSLTFASDEDDTVDRENLPPHHSPTASISALLYGIDVAGPSSPQPFVPREASHATGRPKTVWWTGYEWVDKERTRLARRTGVPEADRRQESEIDQVYSRACR